MGYGSNEHIIIRTDNPELSSRLADNAEQILEAKKYVSSKAPSIVSLITGHDDEVITVSNGVNVTVSPDLVNFKIGDRGLKCDFATNGFWGVYLNSFSTENPVVLPSFSALCAWVYIADATKVSEIRIDVYQDAAYFKTHLHVNSDHPTLINGWNLLRWNVNWHNVLGSNIKTIQKIQHFITTSAATSITIAHVWAECPPKAQLLFIHDGGKLAFYNNGYPDLKARNIPVTWALVCGRIGVLPDYITESQVHELSQENGNSIGIHSWGDLVATNDMTAAQLRADCMKCIKWLKNRGYNDGITWRAAWLQNKAPQHAATQKLWLAYAMASESGVNLETYPFKNPYDIKRIPLHGMNDTPSDLDTYFSKMEDTHAVMVCYTHDVNAAGGADITPTRWEHFLSLIDQGMTEDWLECITFEQLLARSGVKFRQGYGDTIVEIYDREGIQTIKRLP